LLGFLHFREEILSLGSSCHASELIDISLAGGQQSGDDAATVMGEHIAMSAANFSDQAVSAQQGQFAS
jgi:D-alanyl-D-alanine carboxypeptidase